MPVSPTEQAGGQRVNDPENAPKRRSKGKGRGKGKEKGRGKGKGNGRKSRAEVESAGEPPKKRKRKAKQDADDESTPSGMSGKDISSEGPGESKERGVTKAAPKAKANAKSKAKPKGKAAAQVKAKASPKKRGRKPNAETHGKKAKVADGGPPMPPDGSDDVDNGSDDGKPQLTPEQKAIRARNSRKSSAYHRAYKAALKQGMDIADARAHGKEASLIYNMNYVSF